MAKAKKPKSNGSSASTAELELKVERMEVLSMAQDLETLGTQITALQTHIKGLQSEANLANRNLQDAQTKGKELHGQFQARLEALKVKFKVPEDKELNLRTGEFVDKPEQQEAVPSQ